MESQLRVGVDVGCHAHRVGIADPDGSLLEEFDISHSEAGFREFFRRVEERRSELGFPVAVAMEGYNGYARPLDRLVQEKGYRLFNVNNLKLARFKEVFPGAAKTDPIDARKILELFHLRDQLPMAKSAGVYHRISYGDGDTPGAVDWPRRGCGSWGPRPLRRHRSTLKCRPRHLCHPGKSEGMVLRHSQRG
ncbi:MAG: transposase [Candidatus Bipolaricaulis sp.]|nr:transposase [Candidatus Bipolaricaulis sp.]